MFCFFLNQYDEYLIILVFAVIFRTDSYSVDDVLYFWKNKSYPDESIAIDPSVSMAQYALSKKMVAYNFTKRNDRIGKIFLCYFAIQFYIKLYFCWLYKRSNSSMSLNREHT